MPSNREGSFFRTKEDSRVTYLLPFDAQVPKISFVLDGNWFELATLLKAAQTKNTIHGTDVVILENGGNLLFVNRRIKVELEINARWTMS